MNLKIQTIGIISILLLTACFTAVAENKEDEQIIITYNFTEPSFKTVEIDNCNYHRITMPDTYQIGIPNQPNIPMKAARILLPQKTTYTDVQVTGEKTEIEGNYHIEPCGEAITFSTMRSSVHTIIPDEKIYSSSEPFPGKTHDIVGVQSFRGYSILVLNLYPVQYIPASGKISYYTSFKIKVTTEPTEGVNTLFRNLDADRNDVIKLVDNPENLISYQEKTSYTPMIKSIGTFNENYDMIIITSEALLDQSEDFSFYDLRDAHNLQGLKTGITTVEDIDQLYTGDYLSTKIKKFINDMYMNTHIRFVLLGADEPVIPYTNRLLDSPDSTVGQEYVPTDQWYVNLDPDYYPELCIGRACVDSIDEVKNFVYKTLIYMAGENNDYRDVLLAGETLNTHSFGGDYLDEIIGQCCNYGYCTNGIPEKNYFNIHKLYDRDISGEWSKSDIINQLSQSYSFIIHKGHANSGHCLRLDYPDVYSLTNNQFYFIYSSFGCYAGAFDNPDFYDCIAEHFTVKTSAGAFAGVWNTRYGINYGQSQETTDGPSQRACRTFWDAVFDEDVRAIGQALQISKINLANYISAAFMEYIYWELTLFGDPAVEIKIPDEATPPNTPERPIGKETVGKEKPSTYTTSTTDPQGLDVYYLWDWGNELDTKWMGPYKSGEICEATHTWYTESNEGLSVRVKAKNTVGVESDWSDSFIVKVPKSKTFTHNLYSEILKYLMEKFPLLECFIS